MAAPHGDMHPACETRFIHIDDALKDHDKALKEQSTMLVEQGADLKRHSRVLSRLEAQMGTAAEAREDTSKQLAIQTAMLEHLTEEMGEIKKMSWKLIGVLIAAILALAGITKLADVGIF